MPALEVFHHEALLEGGEFSEAGRRDGVSGVGLAEQSGQKPKVRVALG
jgi:hypothetical protein